MVRGVLLTPQAVWAYLAGYNHSYAPMRLFQQLAVDVLIVLRDALLLVAITHSRMRSRRPN